MPEQCSLDFETRSALDLKKAGTYAYFDHPTTDVWCLAYAFDDEEPLIWKPGDSIPERLKDFIERSDKPFAAWNSAFERLAWRTIMVRRYGFPPIDDSRWRCTMTEALSMNLPGKLEHCAPALGLDIRKDDAGHRLMMTMCRPRHTKDGSLRWWDDDEARKQRLYEYCRQDVRVEHAIARRVFRLMPSEQELWQLDMRINDRGVYVDKDLCMAAQYVVQTATERLDKEMETVSEGDVFACSNVQQIIRYLAEFGIVTESIDRENIEDLLLRDTLPEAVRRVLKLRQEGSKTSTAKIKSMLARRQEDGRMRGNLQFYGASDSGRWAARGAQLQNLPKYQILNNKNSIEGAVETLLTGRSDLVDICYGRPLTVVSDCVRSMICAAPGNVLYASDFSNIEGRGAAWLAGQDDKLSIFEALDRGDGPDPYLIEASGLYNVPLPEAGPHRQVGKVASLSLQYQGGARAFAKMAKNYGVRVATLFEGIWHNSTDAIRLQAKKNWVFFGYKTGMSENAFLAPECIKLAWRMKNDRIVKCWDDLEEAAMNAVRDPGTVYAAGRIRYKKAGSFLFGRLPSGRVLSYPYPDIELQKSKTREQIELEKKRAEAAGIEYEEETTRKYQLAYKTIDSFTRKWGKTVTYGGRLFNNQVQGLSRDVMAEAMLRTEKAGYHNVLTVHDEIVAEVPEGFGSLEEFNALMCEIPSWAKGFPITAGGWCGLRYRKA